MDIVLLVLSSLLLLLSLFFALECFSCLSVKNSTINEIDGDKISITVLIPAYNEEALIDETLKSISSQLKLEDKILVVADNCSDRTAEIALKSGAIVIERQDLEHLGKGYALDYGLKHIAKNPPEVVVMIDADCQVEPETIQLIAQKAIDTQKPIQALYLMNLPKEPSTKDLISAFAFKVKNLVRPLGLKKLNQPCLLMGTGMAFPWFIIEQINLATDNIVEDMKLAVDLAIAGYSPVFCSQALIRGVLPQTQKISITQRRRWEHGHIQTLLTYVPILLKESIKQRRLELLAMALDLAIPPLSLLIILWLVLTAFSILIMILKASYIPFLILAIAGLSIFSAVFASWIKFGREELSLITLLKIPLYIMWKVPIYIQFLFNKKSDWVRTKR